MEKEKNKENKQNKQDIKIIDKIKDKVRKVIKQPVTLAKIVLGIIIIVILLNILFPYQSGGVITVSNSTLREILEINELSTVEYTYNAVATKYAKDGKEKKYHVAYNGTILAGINFNEIKFDVDKEKKKINITIPEIEIQEIKVDMGTMEYIFEKSKYETEGISEEAYKLCKEDLEKRITKDSVLYKTAKINAITSIEALFKPWIENMDEQYEIVIK